MSQQYWLLLVVFSILSCLYAPSYGRLPPFASVDVVDENNLTEGAPQSLSLSDAVRLLSLLQQENDLKNNTGRQESREDKEDPRFIGITDGGLYRGDLVFYVPVTILLPTFAFQSRYSLAGKRKYEWSRLLFGRSSARSLNSEADNLLDIRGPVDRVLTDKVLYNPDLQEYKADPNFGPLLSRQDAYFHYLKVHDDDCRMRTVCQLAQNPEKYSPLSYLILSALKKSESFPRPTVYNPVVFRFLRYYWAAERGVAGENCGHIYYKCPADLKDIVNMGVLKFWQNLASYVSIKLSDE